MQALFSKLTREMTRELDEVDRPLALVEEVEAFCHACGFDVEIGRVGNVMWDGRNATLRARNPADIIHDLAHYIVCPPIRRGKVGFGLGREPEGFGKKYKLLVSTKKAQAEESLASLLGVLIERYLGFDWRETAAEHGWVNTDLDQDGKVKLLWTDSKMLHHNLDSLHRKDFITKSGNPTFRDFPWLR